MIRIMHALCTGNKCVAKDNFPLSMLMWTINEFYLFILFVLQRAQSYKRVLR